MLFSGARCFGQDGEFKLYPSGLIYSDSTMSQLEFIVDSLNIKFKACDLDRTYYSKLQAKAHYVYLEKGSMKEARDDMNASMPFDEFIKKHPQVQVEKDLVVVKYRYLNDEKEVAEFTSVLEEQTLRFIDRPDLFARAIEGKWLFKYSSYSKYFQAFYFTTEFKKQPLAEEYARMIQYADCVIDTSTQIFKEDAVEEDIYGYQIGSKVSEFFDFINRESNAPSLEGLDFEEALEVDQEWAATGIPFIHNVVTKLDSFSLLLNEAVLEVLEKGGSNDGFEEYVSKYYSKETALELKRRRIVIGSCSMDDSPRTHAVNIAVLSAETVNWDIFLRAHLDIMNDRFQRVSDGSYAWERRQTYVRELEELDINVPDLLFGICLRIENPSQNHYYGSIGRLGRALSETKYADEIETRMLSMIQDDQLDDYNRVMMYYLFLNYNHHIEEKSKRQENTDKLNNALTEIPAYLASRMKQ